MDLKVRFTLTGENNETTFTLVEVNSGYELYTIQHGKEIKFPLKLKNKILTFVDESSVELLNENIDIINDRLVGLTEEMLETCASGIELADDDGEIEPTQPNYGPDEIFVENKPFSLKQIIDLINEGDIDLSPEFQRNFVWDKTRQSRLIESILLGLPLPAIYLSQYKDGTLTIVDGLQRLTTIKKFMEDELVLNNLEYLSECNGKKKSQLSDVLSPLRMRRFGQTQIMCFVIDYRSPNELKFDLFKRLNTGGKPLNNQEIRNCLSKPKLQRALHTMTTSEEFLTATTYSLKRRRMADLEAALRFMYFYDQYSENNPIGDYNGNMDYTLDKYVDELNNKEDFTEYIEAYQHAMKLAYELFGEYTFRKVYTDYEENSKKPINKLLMLTITILLCQDKYKYTVLDANIDSLVNPLVDLLYKNEAFFNSITWGTNNKRNILLAFKTIQKELFDKYTFSF